MKYPKQLRSLMFVGTGSDVGKSVIVSAFCRIFLQDGYSPAPFKAQNMALNSYATPEGLEIGRAQAVQAEAAKVPCHTDMNPLLLKPTSDTKTQVVLHGKPVGTRSAYAYFQKEGRELLRREVNHSYDALAQRYHPIVMEGAGSVSEINLREVDLVNMPMAIYAGADVILVADIDRGGVFASVYGSVLLMTEEERRHLKGILINKFRGDIRLFHSGIKMLEELCGVPVVGVVPYYNDIVIEEEDSVALEVKNIKANVGKVNVAVILLRHLANFTDFNSLERDPRVHLFFTNNTDEIRKADVILIPGSKSTIADLHELRKNGVAQAIIQAYYQGKTVMGICGGYQMMGQEIADPEHQEGDVDYVPGLGLLPITTLLTGNKVTEQVTFRLKGSEEICHGYEIHQGRTSFVEPSIAESMNVMADGRIEGCMLSAKCSGTYIHGILDNAVVVNFLLAPFLKETVVQEAFDYVAFKEEQYDKLAAHVREHVDMELIYRLIQKT